MVERLNVFISSTSRDLADYRNSVRDIILKLSLYPIVMEAFNATDRNALQLCYDKVQQADIFIGIYAYRYGYAPGREVTYQTSDGKVRTGDGQTGITQWEYFWAIERGLPVLLFVISDTDKDGKPLSWPNTSTFIEEEPGKSRLKSFKDLILGKHVVGFFYSPDNLTVQVTTAIHDLLRNDKFLPTQMNMRTKKIIPFMAPALPYHLTQREQLKASLFECLLDQTHAKPQPGIVALVGSPGFGKTTIALSICHAPEILDAFADGVLWVVIGEHGDNITAKLNEMISAITDAPSNFNTEQDAARHLRALLSDKKCLIVLDDVWDKNHIASLLFTNMCTWLVTTRFGAIAAEIAQRQVIPVTKMLPDEAVQMLINQLPQDYIASSSDYAYLSSFTKRFGEYPLLLGICGSELHKEVVLGKSLQDAGQWMDRFLDEKGIMTFEGSGESLESILDALLTRYSNEVKDRLYELAIFKADIAIPESVVEKLWAVTGNLPLTDAHQLIRQLSGAFFQLYRGMIQIHDILGAYLVEKLSDPESIHETLLNAYNPETKPWHLVKNDGYICDALVYHLKGAGRGDEIWKLFISPDWMHIRRLDKLKYQPYYTDIQQAKVFFQDHQEQWLSRVIALSFIEKSLRSSVLQELPIAFVELSILLGVDIENDVIPVVLLMPKKKQQLEYLEKVRKSLFLDGNLGKARTIFYLMLEIFEGATVSDLDGREEQWHLANMLGEAAIETEVLTALVFEKLTSFKNWGELHPNSYFTIKHFVNNLLFRTGDVAYFDGAEMLINVLLDNLDDQSQEAKRRARINYLDRLGDTTARQGKLDKLEAVIAQLEGLQQDTSELWARYVRSLAQTGKYVELKRLWLRLNELGIAERVFSYEWLGFPQKLIVELDQLPIETFVARETNTQLRSLRQKFSNLQVLLRYRIAAFLWQQQYVDAERNVDWLTLTEEIDPPWERASLSTLEEFFRRHTDLERLTNCRTFHSIASSKKFEVAYPSTYANNLEKTLLILVLSGQERLVKKLAEVQFLDTPNSYSRGNRISFISSFSERLKSIEDLRKLDFPGESILTNQPSESLAYGYLAFKFASKVELDEVEKLMTQWSVLVNSLPNLEHYTTFIHRFIAEGLAIGQGVPQAIEYFKQHCTHNDLYDGEVSLLAIATGLLRLRGAEAAESVLIPLSLLSGTNNSANIDMKAISWRQNPDAETIILPLAGAFSANLSAEKLAEKFSRYNALGIVTMTGVMGIAKSLFVIDEAYAKDFFVHIQTLMIPEPDVYSNLRKAWGKQLPVEENDQFDAAVLHEMAGEEVEPETAKTLVWFLKYAATLLGDGGGLHDLSDVLMLIYKGHIWSIYDAFDLSHREVTVEKTRNVLYVLKLIKEHGSQDAGNLELVLSCTLAIFITIANDYPTLYLELLRGLIQDIDSFLPVAEPKLMFLTVAAFAGEGFLTEAINVAEKFAAQFGEESSEQAVFGRKRWSSEGLISYLYAYICMTTLDLEQRRELLKKIMFTDEDTLSLVIQLIAFFLDQNDNETASLLVDKIVDRIKSFPLDES